MSVFDGGRTDRSSAATYGPRLGLIKAVDRYEPGPGSFTAFAVPTICGEIKHHFRDRTWGMHVHRRLPELTLEIGPAAAELTHVSRLLRHALAWLRAVMLSDVTPQWTGTAQNESRPTLRMLISETNAEINVEVIGEIDRDNTAYLGRRLHSAIALASAGRMVIDLAGALPAVGEPCSSVGVHRPRGTVVPSGGATAVTGAEGTGMAVTSTTPPDDDIRRGVLTELRFDAEVGQSEIGVIVDDQVATLTGWVDSLAEK